MPVNSRNNWISGLFNSLFSKSFEDIRDEEISIFITKFKKSFKELERLIDLHQLNNTRDNESVCAIDIIDKNGNVKQEQIVFPVEVSAAYEKSVKDIDNLMKKLQVEERKALLLKKLQEMI